MLVATQYLLQQMTYDSIVITASNLKVSSEGELVGVNKWMIVWMNGICVSKKLKRFIAVPPPEHARRSKRFFEDTQWNTPQEAYEFWKSYGESIIARFKKAEEDARS